MSNDNNLKKKCARRPKRAERNVTMNKFLNIISSDVEAVKRLTYDERNELAARINAADPCNIFEEAGTTSNPDKRRIICPNCGNGEGNDHTPVDVTFKDGQWLYNCFKCNEFSGNLLKIIAHEQNLNLSVADDFAKALAIGAAIIGENVSTTDYRTSRNITRKKNSRSKTNSKVYELPEPAAEYERLAEARGNVEKFFADRTDWRKLPKEIFERLGWGVLWDYCHPANNFKFPAVIIPNDRNGILARQIDGDAKSNITPTVTTTIVKPTADKILFVVEGAIDGASIAHVTNFQYGVIAIGGTSGTKNLPPRLNELFSNDAPKPKIILLLDNDGVDPKTNKNPGQDAAAKILPKLRDMGFITVNRVICDEPRRDPNKILADDGEQNLRERIEKIIEDARGEFEELENQMSEKTSGTTNDTTNDQSATVPANDTDIPELPKTAIEDWEADNGKINPEFLPKIVDANNLLESMTPETITAGIAQSSKIKRAVAICEVYNIDVIAESATNFRAKLDIARNRAAAQIKANNDPEKISVEAQALKTLSMTNWNKAIADEVAKLKRARKKYLQMEAIRAEQEAAKKGREERAAARQSDIEKLDELRKEAQTTKRDAEIISRINSACDWKLDRHGEPVEVKDTAANAELIFGNDPNLDGAIGFDEFQQADVILKKLPWHNSDQSVGELFKNRDGSELRVYLRKNYSEFGKNAQSVDDFLIRFSNQHCFHPVKEFFANLPAWDGKTRAETIFIDFLRVDDTPYAREVTLNWLIAAVARIYFPGCRYQTALIVNGDQGIGKSYIFERLGGKWFGVLNTNVEDSHCVDEIQNLWIGEFREMKAMKKSDRDAIKSFIDTAEDNRRPPYGRRTEKTKRHIIFGITTNDPEFLNDPTGNRRFPILECHNERGKFIEGLTDDYIAQVWAEVKIKFKELFTDETGHFRFDEKKLSLSSETKNLVEEIASRHMRDDGLINEIKAFVDVAIPPRVIWQLFSREERRKFCVDRQIYIAGGKAELEFKRRAIGGRNVEADIRKIYELLSEQNENKFFRQVSNGSNDAAIVIYGAERRQHISAGEILNEGFAPTDKRVSMRRIGEILPTLDGWKLGNRIQNDTAYKDQKKVYWRVDKLEETSPEPKPETPTNEQNSAQSTTTNEPETSNDDFFGGEFLTENPPF